LDATRAHAISGEDRMETQDLERLKKLTERVRALGGYL
jgi:hypothetical protein